MSDKPISPLRQRMIDDMTARRFSEKVQKGVVTLPCEERERSRPYGYSNRRDGLAPRGHRRGT